MVGLRSREKAKTLDNRGYTIIEVMIFLAVSAGLLMSVMSAISGQQQKTQFTTGVRDFETRLQDIVNDVETGYYPNNESTQCADNNDPDKVEVGPAPGGKPQGTNKDCIYLGKALGFSVPSGSTGYISYETTTIAGSRKKVSTAEDVASINDARPTPFNLNGNGVETGELLNGLELTAIHFWDSSLTKDPSPTQHIGIVANISTTDRASGTVTAVTGRPKLVYMSDSTIHKSKINTTNMNKAGGGAAFCVRDGGAGGRVAAVTLGIRLSGLAPPAQEFQLTGQTFSTEVYFDNDAAKFGCT